MRPTIASTIGLNLLMAGSLFAGTFDKAPLAPALGVDALSKGFARERVGRQVFSNPYATVTLGSVDVYNVFPYVESRHFQIVSDPAWNRIVFGEVGKSLRAFDGNGSAFGALAEPRGMAVDEQNRLYLADTGHDRILVFRTETEFDAMTLVPLFAIDGLHRPYDVAFSDGGTPFAPGDDYLYVADTGRNRIVAYGLDGTSARKIAEIGELGSGVGHFAGPMALATGRRNGVATNDVYVADVHSRRLVHLRLEASGFVWAGERRHDADVVTSLDTDQWGNVYAAAPNRGAVEKFNSELAPVAELETNVTRPRSFHVPFLNVRDHRNGSVRHLGQPSGVLVEDWAETSGMKLWTLGLELADLAVVDQNGASSRFTLTDHANVTFEVTDGASGRVLSRRDLGAMDAGSHTIALAGDEMALSAGGNERILRVAATSGYEGGPAVMARTNFSVSGTGAILPPSQPLLLANVPNPVFASTRIGVVMPNDQSDASLVVLDARGRMVRRFHERFSPGLTEVVWDGRDDRGSTVSAGIYFYRLVFGPKSITRKMVLVK